MLLIAAITVAMFGGLAVFAWFYWFYNYTQREAYASSLKPPDLQWFRTFIRFGGDWRDFPIYLADVANAARGEKTARLWLKEYGESVDERRRRWNAKPDSWRYLN